MKKLSVLLAVGAAAIATPALADGGLTFVIDGDTFDQSYTITNTSTLGETVVGFGVTLIAPFGFDTVNGGFGVDQAAAFAPRGGSDVITGYTGPASFADGVNTIDFTFTNFDVGESFIWGIDVDRPDVATVFGDELIGSTGYADFSNGLRGNGVFEAFGNRGAQFVIKTFTPRPNVPEPATWAMLVLGFGVLGTALRRTRCVRANLAYT